MNARPCKERKDGHPRSCGARPLLQRRCKRQQAPPTSLASLRFGLDDRVVFVLRFSLLQLALFQLALLQFEAQVG